MKINKFALLFISSLLLSACVQQQTPQQEGHKHEFNVETIAATCTEEGYTRYSCKTCDYSFTTISSSAKNHTYEECEEVKATIEHEGCEHHYKCKTCGKYFNDQFEEVTLESLSNHLPFFDIKDLQGPVSFEGKSLNFQFDKNVYVNLLDTANDSIIKIKNTVANAFEVSAFLETLIEKINYLTLVYQKASIKADFYNTQQDHEIKTEIYDTYTNLLSSYYKICYELGLNQTYKQTFYYGYSNAAFDAFMNQCKPYADNDVVEANKNMNKVLADYKAGKKSAFESFSDYVNYSKIYANGLGYDNYLEYAYTNIYGRDYSIEKTADLKSYIKNYIVPLYNDVYSEVLKFESMAAFSFGGEYQTAMENNIKLEHNFFGNYLAELIDYSKYLGGDYYANFCDYFVDQNYYYSNIENPNITAYVTTVAQTPIMFMSPNYQNLSTFIHEFGHYNAEFTYGGLTSYDIAETQSQGNEMLFYTYLIKNNLVDEYTGKYFVLNKLLSMLDSVIVGYEINEVEKFAYKGNFTKQQLERKWLDVATSIGLSNEGYIDYLYLVLLNYQGYYISYSTSAIASIELFATALNNMEAAKSAYKTFYNGSNRSLSFQNLLTKANLYNVFSNSAYTLIDSISDHLL